MHFVRTRQLLGSLTDFPDAGLHYVSPVGSTNDWFRDPAHGGVAEHGEFTVVVSDWQTGGRGRLGRVWQSPQGKCLAISVLVRPAAHGLEPDQYSWLPLLVGNAVCNALNVAATRFGLTEPPFALKWPNDVLVLYPDSGTSLPELSKVADEPAPFSKISGVLSELQADASVILGAGINLLLTEDELPVPTATSLSLALEQLGANTIPGAFPTAADLFDEVAFEYLTQLSDLYRRLIAASGDAVNAGIRSEVAENLATLDQRVRVDLPGDRQLIGVVSGLGAQGELMLRTDDGEKHSILAGDITHLRQI